MHMMPKEKLINFSKTKSKQANKQKQNPKQSVSCVYICVAIDFVDLIVKGYIYEPVSNLVFYAQSTSTVISG